MARWQRTAVPGRRRSRFGGGRLLIAAVLAIMAVVGYMRQKTTNEITGETHYVVLSHEQEVALGLEAAPLVPEPSEGER